MASEIRAQLQTSLGEGYTLGRELGGGGMSRVFVARESALGRDVVVKVLTPELASGLSADRFRREILLAATFQHPCIVPVLTAGQLGVLPFFTMPYVQGESLRARLAQHGALPLGEVHSIIRDVASALAYAHERGVVHRDIKPDNVLLSGGYAVVTDFGIAKALSSARTESGTATLTSIGTSLGTPAYMAPEQAAGDPDTDHRADLYALGCLAYELLAGRPPFDARAPHRMLAAHISETPAPVTDHRPETPPALAALVMRLLEKEPARRPGTAGEVLQTLDAMGAPSGGEHATLPAISLATRRTLVRALAVYATAFIVVAMLARLAMVSIGLPDWVYPVTLVVMALGLPAILFTAFVHHGSRVARTTAATTPGGTVTTRSTMHRIAVTASPHVSWRRTTWGGVMAGLAVVLGVGAYMALRALGIGPAGSLLAAGKIDAKERLLVADFRTSGADSALGGVVAEAVRATLGQSRTVTVVPQSLVSAALQRMQRPITSRLDLTLAREVAEREGIKAIVHGEVTPLGGGYIVSMRLIVTESGDELASLRETAKTQTDLIPAIDKVTRQLRGRLGESLKTVRASPSLAQVTTSSLPALRKYTEGMRANYGQLDYASAAAAFEEAIRLDSTFAMAYRMLNVAYRNMNVQPERRRWLRDRAFALRERLPERERLMIEAYVFLIADRPRAIRTLERAVELDPANTTALNALANTYSSQRAYARAESLYRRAIAVADGNVQPQSNIVAVLIAEGKLDQAKAQITVLKSRFPQDSLDTMSSEAVLEYLRGDYDSTESILRRVSRHRSDVRGTSAAFALANLALVRGRIREWKRLEADAEVADAARGAITDPLQLALDSALVDIWFGQRGALDVARLDNILRRRPLGSVPIARRPYLTAARAWALAGRPERARALVALYDTEVGDTTILKGNFSFRHFVTGEIALAQRRFQDAVAAFRAADRDYDGEPVPCATCAASGLVRAFDLAGMADSAIVTFEGYLSSSWPGRLEGPVDPYMLARSHERLGELYDDRGVRDKAAEHYAAFVDLWKNADPGLQPQVAAARRRLARLRQIESAKR